MSEKLNSILSNLEKHEPTFRTTLLSNKAVEIEFRPMRTKDQKALIINTEDESYQNQIKGLIALLKGCIKKSPHKIEELYIQDFIWLVLNLRIKSVGETVDIVGICTHCDKKTPNLKIHLEKDVKISYLKDIKDSIVDVTPDLKIVLTFPKIKHIITKKNNDLLVDLLADEIYFVEYQGQLVDLTTEEKVKLLDSLDSNVIKKFEEFLEVNEFGVEVNFKYTCSHCKEENTIALKENILSFF